MISLVGMFCACFANSGQGIPVHRIVVDTGLNAKAEIKYRRSLYEQYGLDTSRLGTAGRRYHIDAPDDFHVATGMACFIEPGGREWFARFWTLPDKPTFERFVETYLESREDGIVVDRNNTGTDICISPRPGAKRRKKVYLRYLPGFMALSTSDSLPNVDLEQAKLWARRAGQAHNGLAIAPERLPPELLEKFLKQMQLVTETALQQRDSESSRAYRGRRALGDASKYLVDSVAESVEELWVREKWPYREDAEFEFEFIVTMKPNSSLAAVCASLKQSSRLRLPESDADGRIVSVRLNAGVPDRLRAFATKADLDGSSSWIGLGSRILGTGRIDLVGNLLFTDRGSKAAASMVWPDDVTPIDFLKLIPRIDPTSLSAIDKSAAGTIRIPETSFGLPNQVSVRAGVVDGRLDTTVHVTDESTAPPVSAPNPSERRNVYPIAEVDLDLSPLTGQLDEPAAKRFLESLERLYDHFVFVRHLSRYDPRERDRLLPMGGFRLTADPTTFRSLTKDLPENGAWAGKMRVSTTGSGRQLTVKVTLGRDLHRAYIARGVLADGRTRISEPDAPTGPLPDRIGNGR